MIRIKDKKYHTCTLCRLNGTTKEATWTDYGKYFCESCKAQEAAQIKEYYDDDRSTHHKEAPVIPKSQFKESHVPDRTQEIEAIAAENPNVKSIIPQEHWDQWQQAAEACAPDPALKGGEAPF